MKNENRDLFGSYTAGYDDLRIKQMMPLPENMIVMALDVDDDDNIIMREAGETTRVYCLVLVDDGKGNQFIYPYDLSTSGGIDVRANVVPVRNCKKCGKRMHPVLPSDIDDVSYVCDCGHKEPGWPELKYEEDETNE